MNTRDLVRVSPGHFVRFSAMGATFRFVLNALALTVVLVAPLSAQTFQGIELVKAELLLDPATKDPGKPFTVGLRMRMASHWHTYWQYSGDFGLPTEIKWELPSGYVAGAIQWPLPNRMMDGGNIITFGYSDEVLLLTEITPPSGATTFPVIKAKVSWLVCKESCVPGDADLTLNPSPTDDAASKAAFAQARASLPRSFGKGAGFEVARSITKKEIVLAVTGLSPGELENVYFFPLPPADGSVVISAPIVERTGDRVLVRIPLQGETSANAGKVVGVMAFERGGKREGFEMNEASFSSSIASAPPPGGQRGLLQFLWLGFLGGLILNVMPCVLPVLSLKIFGFMQQAGEAPRRVLHLGLAYSTGVFVWFLGLAALLVSFRAAGSEEGWGFLFQRPLFLAGLSAVTFVFALNLLGVFEIVLPGGMQNRLSGATTREGLSGAFFQGLLATVLATSCTAPFLGTALGFALGQAAPVVFTVFGAIALGMALPVLLLTARPGWMRFLPKPGVWMERVKQLTGFLLISTILFLLWVLGKIAGVDAVIWAGVLLLALAMAGWIYGTFVSFSSSGGGRAAGLAAIAVLVLGLGGFSFAQIRETPPESGAIVWEKYSPARLEAAIRAKQPVFIDFTADWCVNCKANERLVLETDVVRAALRERGFLALKGDWTRSDPEITRVLRRYQRAGVPLYLVYAAGNPEPQVLPELLTQRLVLEALAAPSSPSKVALAEDSAGSR